MDVGCLLRMCCTSSYALCLLYFLPLAAGLDAFNEANMTISPATLNGVLMGEERTINVTYACDVADIDVVVRATSDDADTADVVGPRTRLLCGGNSSDNDTSRAQFRIAGKFLGKVTLTFCLTAAGNETAGCQRAFVYNVTVIREEGIFYRVFIAVTIVLVVIINVGFGCSIDVEVVKAILLKPIPPAIGFLCQFGLMPILGFIVSRVLQMRNVFAFGVLVAACAPGGGASNVWTLLLGGDLDLSLTMTFLSKIAAIGMVPFWMWTLGRFYVDSSDIAIPYANMASGMAGIGIPCLTGVLITRFRPQLGQRMRMLIKPFAGVFLLWVIIAGSLTNFFIYRIMFSIWYIIPAGMMLPYVAFPLGYVIACVARQTPQRAVTIAIETGIQDTGVAILLLLATFPKPDGDMAAAIPMTVAMLTPLPLVVTFCVVSLRRRLQHRVSDNKDDKDAEKANGVAVITNGDLKTSKHLDNLAIIQPDTGHTTTSAKQ